MTDMKPKFGRWFRNTAASNTNPTQDGMFVRSFRRQGRLNPGLHWELTDGKGRFWQIQPKWLVPLILQPASDHLVDANKKVAARDAVREVLRKLADHVRPTCSELYDEAMTALAAPVQPVVDVSSIIREVAELPDRNSPEGWPEAMLVTADELDRIVLAHCTQAVQPVVDGWMPIETAPRKGRELILLLTPSGWPQVAYSNTWWTAGFSVECKPTHWARIPPITAQPGEVK